MCNKIGREGEAKIQMLLLLGEGIISQGFFVVDVDDAMLFGGVNATQFRFFMKWEIIFFERFLFHFRKIWKIMPLKSTIFSLRKEVYISWHTPCCSNFFVFVVIMNSTLIQSKEKKFWEKIYYNYIQSNDLKSGEKKVKKNFFLFLCIMPLGGNIFVTIVNIGST